MSANHHVHCVHTLTTVRKRLAHHGVDKLDQQLLIGEQRGTALLEPLSFLVGEGIFAWGIETLVELDED